MTDSSENAAGAPLPPYDPACIPMGTLGRSFDSITHALQTGALDDQYGVIRWSSNYAALLAIDKRTPSGPTTAEADKAADELPELLAVYKPKRGERPLWDFPDGTLYQRERAAYLTSQALGWEIVPPTVVREGPHGVGTFQLFIEHDPNLHYFHLDESGFGEAVIRPQLMRIAAFDVLLNNADRKGGHCLLDGVGHLWGIDQGLTFNAQHKLRTVIWDFAGQPIPEAIMADIERLCAQLDDPASPYAVALAELLASGEVRAFRNRIGLLIRRRRYPHPGGGPSYPWPAV